MRHYIRTPKSTHDNTLRRLGRAMAVLARKQVAWAQHPGVNRVRREKKALRRELGLTTGRAWRRWLKAANRGRVA